MRLMADIPRKAQRWRVVDNALYLLGQRTQPDDAGLSSMNLPLTCQAGRRLMAAALEHCASLAVMALLTDWRRSACPATWKSATCWMSYLLNADDLHSRIR